MNKKTTIKQKLYSKAVDKGYTIPYNKTTVNLLNTFLKNIEDNSKSVDAISTTNDNGEWSWISLKSYNKIKVTLKYPKIVCYNMDKICFTNVEEYALIYNKITKEVINLCGCSINKPLSLKFSKNKGIRCIRCGDGCNNIFHHLCDECSTCTKTKFGKIYLYYVLHKYTNLCNDLIQFIFNIILLSTKQLLDPYKIGGGNIPRIKDIL